MDESNEKAKPLSGTEKNYQNNDNNIENLSQKDHVTANSCECDKDQNTDNTQNTPQGSERNYQEVDHTQNTPQGTENDKQGSENDKQGSENDKQGSENDKQGSEIDEQHSENPQDTNKLEQEESVATVALKRKKPKMEIEIDFKLLDGEFDDGIVGRCKTRDRQKVVKYEDIPIPKAEQKKKKNPIKDRKKRIKYENGEEEFVCEICHLPFMTIQALIGHRKSHLKKHKFTCALCSKEFETNVELIKHKIVHKDEERDFLCMKCQTAFTNHLDYLKHKLTHQNLQKYKCAECGKEYNKKHGFIIHIETHFDTKMECEICHRILKSHALKNHMMTHNRTIKCVECGKACTDKKTYEYHMISHTGVKPYQCLYCGRGFANNGQRKIHTRTHTDEKPYECDVCHHKFRQPTDLKRHLITHTTEKTLECEVCHRKFFRKESLKDHMDIHNNTQRFKCGICDKRYHTKPSLTNHLQRYHSKEKTFHCKPCDKWFVNAADLRKHKRWKSHINNEFGYNRKIKMENND